MARFEGAIVIDKPNPTSPPHRFLTFAVDQEQYAVPMGRVNDIVGARQVVPVALSRQAIRGVVDVRGRLVPVVDLRVLFGAVPDDARRTATIVVETTWRSRPCLVGLLVDAVHEVMTLDAADVSLVFAGGTEIPSSFVRGVANTAGGLRLIVDGDNLVTEDEFDVLSILHTQREQFA
jgi:purine-binding chemotaxis protein CheW